MRIVAFLQNMWVRDPEKVKRMITRDDTGKLRARLIRYALFAGCLTGQRLKAALGEELCEEITWEEANPTIAGNSHDYYPPDPEHIRKVLDQHEPRVVVCFTRRGEDIIRSLVKADSSRVFISSPHPASRQPGITEMLRLVKGEILTAAGMVKLVNERAGCVETKTESKNNYETRNP